MPSRYGCYRRRNLTLRSLCKLTAAGICLLVLAPFTQADPIVAGDILISNHGGSDVQLLDPTTGIVSTLVSVSGTPIGLAFDGSKNLYINVNDGIQRYNPGTGTLDATFFTGSGQREGLTFDPVTQNLFSVSFGGDHIEEVDLAGNLVNTINIPGSADLLGISARGGELVATDYGNGNVYLSNTLTPTVWTTIANIAGGNIYAPDIDAAGNIFVNDFATGTVVELAAGTFAKSTFISGLSGPDNGLSIGDNGNFTISQFYANEVSLYDSSGALIKSFSGVANPDELVVFAPVRSGGGGGNVPEPGTVVLLGTALLSLGTIYRRKNRA